MIKLLLASPYPALRVGLRILLEAAAGLHPQPLTVVGEAATLGACHDWVRETQPEVVLYDLILERGDDLDGLWQLCRSSSAVLALSELGDDRRTLTALQAGARGCLPKTLTGPELAEAVLAAAAGESIVPPATTALLLQQLRGEAPHPALSPREAEVLRGVAAGQTNKAIGLKLGISEHTVKFHLGGAMNKLGATSRAEAVALALRQGLIAA